METEDTEGPWEGDHLMTGMEIPKIIKQLEGNQQDNQTPSQ